MAGMEDMLKRQNVQIVEKVNDWEESVHVAVQPLVDQGYVKSDYIDGIISNAKEFGPYFVICPDLALLHARPEQGVIKRQLAVTVRTPTLTLRSCALSPLCSVIPPTSPRLPRLRTQTRSMPSSAPPPRSKSRRLLAIAPRKTSAAVERGR